MEDKIFLFRPEIMENESLTSYIQRISKTNFTTPGEICKLLMKNHNRYPQSSVSHLIDLYPKDTLDIKLFEKMLRIKEDSILKLTFTSVYKKLRIEENKMIHSRLLSDMIDIHRKYCPKCIGNKLAYKLIWQVREINICDIHNIKLQHSCWSCGREIPLIPFGGDIGQCPHCGMDFSLAPIVEDNNELQHRIYEDWKYLLKLDTNNLNISTNGVSVSQALALKLLYINKKILNHTHYSNLLQSARNSKSIETNIHLNTMLSIIHEANINIHDFFSLHVPNNFVNNILNHNHKMISKFSCQSPWCKNYKVSGTLERTATSSKKSKNGNTYNFYMFCPKCSVNYCLTHEDKILVERGYFISVGWYQIRPLILQGKSIAEISMLLNVSEDRIKRSIIFMASNNIISCCNLPLKLPQYHDKELVKLFKKYIKLGVGTRDMRRKFFLSYNEFLFYWLYAEIQIEHIIYVHARKGFNNCKIDYKHKLDKAIEFLVIKDVPITIKKICDIINVSHETLRNHGLLKNIQEAKKVQNEEENAKKNKQLLIMAKNVINEKLLKGEEIMSSDIYKSIGASRTSLSRKFPYITKQIHKLMKYAKS